MKYDELNFSGIYCLEFASGKYYVGKANNVYKRFRQHCSSMLKGEHAYRVQLEYDKVRILPVVRLLKVAEAVELDKLECEFIAEFVEQYGVCNMLNTQMPRQAQQPGAGGTEQLQLRVEELEVEIEKLEVKFEKHCELMEKYLAEFEAETNI